MENETNEKLMINVFTIDDQKKHKNCKMLNAISSKTNQLHQPISVGDNIAGKATSAKRDEAIASSASPFLLTTTTSNNNNNNINNSNHSHRQNSNSSGLSIPVTSSSTNTQVTSSEVSSTTNPLNKGHNNRSHHHDHHQNSGPPHYVDLHVNAGECVSLQLIDGQERVVAGPATITMISQQQNPPVPIPVQVPPGHMIHQIADENGTLKHIILSVMDTSGDETLDSTMITLPQGTFRINSNGDLVSASGGANGDGNGIPLTTLPQQAYFASYDGCPVAYDAPNLPDSLDITATQINQQQATKSIHNNKLGGQSSKPFLSSGQTVTTASHSPPSSSSPPPPPTPTTTTTTTSTSLNSNSNQVSSNRKENLNQSGTGANFAAEAEQMVVQQNNNNNNANAHMSDITYPLSPITTTTSNTSTATTETATPIHNNESELVNGGPMMPSSMISTVEAQLYGYPPANACCCCCSYCETNQDTTSGTLVQPRPQELILTATPADSTTTGTNHRMPSRVSGNNLSIDSRISANGIPQVAYGPMTTMMSTAPSIQHQSSMTPLHGSTITTPPMNSGGSPIIGGSQNGNSYPSMELRSGVHSTSKESSREGSGKIQHGMGGKGGRNASNTYMKHHKLSNGPVLQVVSNSHNINDRSYGNYYQHNNSVSDPYHHHTYHHKNHHQNNVDGSGLSTAYRGAHKSHQLINHKNSTSSLAVGSSSYCPASHNYNTSQSNHTSTTTMASIVSSSINNKSNPLSSSPSYRLSDNGNDQSVRGTTRDSMNYPNPKHHSNNDNNNKRLNNENKLVTHHQQNHQNHNNNNSHHLHYHHNHQNSSHNSSNSRYISTVKAGTHGSHQIVPTNPSIQNSVSPIRSRMKTNNNNSSSISISSSSNGGRSLSSSHSNHNNSHHTLHHASGSSSNSSHEMVNNKEAYNPKANQSGASSVNQSSLSTTPSVILSTSHYSTNDQQHELQNTKSLPTTTSKPTTSYASAHHQHHHHHQQQQQQHNHHHHHHQDSSSSRQNIVSNLNNSTSLSAKSTVWVSGKNTTILHSQQISKNKNTDVTQYDGTLKLHQHNVTTNLNSSATRVTVTLQETNNQESSSGSSTGDQQLSITDSNNLDQQTASRASRGKQKKCQNNNNNSNSNNSSSNSNSSGSNSNSNNIPRHTSSKNQSIISKKNHTQTKSIHATATSTQPNSASGVATTKKSSSAATTPNVQNLNKSLSKEVDNESDFAERSAKKATASSKVNTNQTNTTLENSKKSNNAATKNLTPQEDTNLEEEQKNQAKIVPVKEKQREEEEPNAKREEESQSENKCDSSTSSPADSKGTQNDSDTIVHPPVALNVNLHTSSAPTTTSTIRISHSENNLTSLINKSSSTKIHHDDSSATTANASETSKTTATDDLVLSYVSDESVKGSSSDRKHQLSNSSSSESCRLVSKSATRKKSAPSEKQSHQQGKGSNAKSEQKVPKLHLLPQLRILNLACASVTSSSVQLRWCYFPGMADKYNISHHHSKSNGSTSAHFVIESSNAKNHETNCLVSPKIVFQGCALSCRINHLSSDKIYHFRVRRTNLLTPPKGLESISNHEEHLVVSDVLSVTLANVQQYQQQVSSSSTKKTSNSNRSFNNQRSSSDTVLSLESQQATTFHYHQHNDTVAMIHGSNNPQRGNTSSQQSNSNNYSLFGGGKSNHIKFSNLFKQWRVQLVALIVRTLENALSSCSDGKFAGLLLVIFTTFAMLLALFIHLYILAPVNE